MRIVIRRARGSADPRSIRPARMGRVEMAEGLTLERGGRLSPCRMAYEIVGPPDAPVVAVLGGISAGRHVCAHERNPAPGWWEEQAGPGRPLDPRRFRLLGVDWVHGTRGGEPLALTPADQARALTAVLDRLEVESLAAAVGASYGGMVVLALAALRSRRLERAVVISAAHESHPMATAHRVLQRRMVRLGLDTGRTREGMILARALAMTTYRSDREFRGRFSDPATGGEEAIPARFPVEEYLEHHGRTFADRFNPSRFLCLCQSLDLHRVDPARVQMPLTLVSVDTDTLVPPWQMRELHDALEAAELRTVRSLRGHDAFLADAEPFGRILKDFLEPLESAGRGGDRGCAH